MSKDEKAKRGHLLRWFKHREVCLVVLIGLVVCAVTRVDARFLAVDNLRDILVRSAPTLIVACGVMLVVVVGEIDISVGSLTALLAAAMGVMLSADHWSWPVEWAVPGVLLLGTLVGWGTGLLVTLGQVPSIIVTLGLLTALRGLAVMIMGGQDIDGLPPSMQQWTKQGVANLPLSVWVAGGVLGLHTLLIYWTPLGRRLYALGSSPYAATMSGLSSHRLKQFAFAYTGFLTALAALVEVPRLPKIESGIGAEFELLVVTCVVVGGVAVAGGRGTVSGVLLAVLLMTMIRPVLTFLDLGEAGEKWTKAIQGGFILATVVIDIWRGARGPVRLGQ